MRWSICSASALDFDMAKPLSVLVTVQAVDPGDPLMGYFSLWLKEFGKEAHVIACGLRVADPPPDLGPNVDVVPLRRRGSRSRFEVLRTLWRVSWKRRRDYDAVFVRSDPQYVVLAGWLWKLLGKRVVLFYAHHVSTPWLRPASLIADAVLTSFPGACPVKNAVAIGQGVDATRFSTMHHHGEDVRICSLSRVSAVKRIPWALDVIAANAPEIARRVTVHGRETDAHEADLVSAAAQRTGARWARSDVALTDVPATLDRFDVFFNASPGSLDKTIVEAMLTGLVVVASTPGYGEMLPDDLRWLHPTDAEFGAVVVRAARLPAAERAAIGSRLRALATERHSQSQQIAKVRAQLAR